MQSFLVTGHLTFRHNGGTTEGLLSAGLHRELHHSFDESEKGDPLPYLQRAGHLGRPVLLAFRARPPPIVAKNVAKVSSRFNR